MTKAEQLPKQAILVVNTHSRMGAEGYAEVVELLERAGVALIDKQAISDPGHLAFAVREAVGNAPMVIVGGGDGTLSSTIDVFKDKTRSSA